MPMSGYEKERKGKERKRKEKKERKTENGYLPR
jgi:hypothetical protein